MRTQATAIQREHIPTKRERQTANVATREGIPTHAASSPKTPAMPALPFPFADGDYPADKIDPDYLYFLRHLRPDGNSYVLELPSDGASPPSVLKYEPPIAISDGECVSDPSPGRASTNRRMEEKDSSVEAEVEADPSWLDSLVDIDEDYRLFLQHTRVVNDRMVLEIGGVVVNYEPDAARSGGSSGVEEEETMGEKEMAIASSGIRVGVGEEEEKGVDSDEPVVIVPKPKTWDWRADRTPGQKVEGEEDEGLLNASALRTPETRKREKSLSNGHDAEPHVASGSQGVIWPTHINQRPDSDFKRRLMEVLLKPISRREYIKLFDMASIRTPLVKLRQVRNDVKFYPTDEMGNSYFDHYPDLVEQVTNTTFSNGLALMRGFFFWLQNTAHEDQFRPWIDDSKDHEVIPLVD